MGQSHEERMKELQKEKDEKKRQERSSQMRASTDYDKKSIAFNKPPDQSQ